MFVSLSIVQVYCNCIQNVFGVRQQLGGRKDCQCAQNPVCVCPGLGGSASRLQQTICLSYILSSKHVGEAF